MSTKEEMLSKRAKEIIQRIFYITLATVSSDGEPWNSPVYSAYDEDYNFYWASDQNGQHSQNIDKNGKAFIVVYDSTVPEGTGEGVYIQALAKALETDEEIKNAMVYLDGRVGKKKDPTKRIKEFQGDRPRRVYQAVPQKVWINGDGEINGYYIDTRVEVKLS